MEQTPFPGGRRPHVPVAEPLHQAILNDGGHIHRYEAGLFLAGHRGRHVELQISCAYGSCDGAKRRIGRVRR